MHVEAFLPQMLVFGLRPINSTYCLFYIWNNLFDRNTSILYYKGSFILIEKKSTLYKNKQKLFPSHAYVYFRSNNLASLSF